MPRYVGYVHTTLTCTEGKFNDREEAINWMVQEWKHSNTTETILYDEELNTIEYHQIRKQERASYDV